MLQPGTKLGPHEILSLLGAGGMGEVYKARDTRLDGLVAIKILSAHLSERPELRERFEREARAIASLKHPHICVLYDVGQQDDIHYLVMEHLPDAQTERNGNLRPDPDQRGAELVRGAETQSARAVIRAATVKERPPSFE